MLPRLMVSGASGLLGLNILAENFGKFDLCAIENNRKIRLPVNSKVHVDMSDLAGIEATLRVQKPDIVIHSAGMTNVDACEAAPELANCVNAELAENMARVTSELGIKFVQISTDHLFDGTKCLVSEDEKVAPLNAYGYSKALAEDKVLGANPDSIVVRCNFFGWGPSYRASFSDHIHDSIAKGQSVSLVDDIFYTPASTNRLIASLLGLAQIDATGIFNLVGDDRVSKYEFGLGIASAFGLDVDLIKRIKFRDLEILAVRPRDMSLSNRKVTRVLGKGLGSLESNIQILKSQCDSELIKQVRAS